MQRIATEPAAMLADEFRLGSTWDAVTPAVTPSPVLGSVAYFGNGNSPNGGNGSFQLAFTNNNSAQTFTIYGSTNLVDWQALGEPLQTSSNLYQFTDLEVTNFTHRFYQLRSP